MLPSPSVIYIPTLFQPAVLLMYLLISTVASSIGVGPVDASMKAIVKCFAPMSKVKLLEYNIDAVTGGTEALGHVSIELMDLDSNYIVRANATHEDIVMSSVLALLKGLNRIMKKKNV